MDYNCGIYFPQSGEGYISFVDPADDSWIERHLEGRFTLSGTQHGCQSKTATPKYILHSPGSDQFGAKCISPNEPIGGRSWKMSSSGSRYQKSYFPTTPKSPVVVSRKAQNRRRHPKPNCWLKFASTAATPGYLKTSEEGEVQLEYNQCPGLLP
nr:hypothetical protein BgiMline_034981 [Biomphalaria glabrata]